ncbi:MAG: hypothetical protein R3B51_11055 [Thermodesulfobacteriota bacterium]
MRLSLVRYSMRDSLALWNKLQEKNKGVELAAGRRMIRKSHTSSWGR